MPQVVGQKKAVEGTPRRSTRHMTDLEKVKSVSFIVQGPSRQSNYKMNQFSDAKKKKRCSYDESFCNLVKENSEGYSGYRIPYEGLKMREHSRRVVGLAATIISSCVDRESLMDKGVEYLIGNKDLAVDILTVIDSIRNKVQDELRVNLHLVQKEITPPPVDESDDKCGDDDKYNRYSSAIAMLGEASIQGYERMRKKILVQNLLSSDALPSYHMLTKNRPKIILFVVLPDLHFDSLQSTSINSDTINDTMVSDASLIPLALSQSHGSTEDALSSFIGNTSISLEDAFKEVITSSNDIYVAKLDGNYCDYVGMMVKKHHDMKRGLNGSVIVIDSYDGAEHHSRRDKTNSIISFSSQMFSQSTVKKGNTPAQSFNILTWQQVEGKECAQNMFPAIRSVLESKNN